jgi:hypothetical protein
MLRAVSTVVLDCRCQNLHGPFRHGVESAVIFVQTDTGGEGNWLSGWCFDDPCTQKVVVDFPRCLRLFFQNHFEWGRAPLHPKKRPIRERSKIGMASALQL